jgi:anti-sigma factor RsiW
MRCRTAGRLMSLQLDNALTPEEKERLSEHLEHCPRCQNAWMAMRQVDSLFSGAECVEPAPGLVGRVLLQLPADRRAVAAPSPVWVRAGLLATAAVVVLLVGVGAIILVTGTAAGQGDWGKVWEAGRAAVVSGWENASRLLAAAKDVARALWLGFGRPWLPVIIPVFAGAAFLWGWLLYRNRRRESAD